MLGNTPDVIGAVRALEARAHLVGFNMLRVGKDYKNKRRVLDLSRFRAAPRARLSQPDEPEPPMLEPLR